MFSAGSSWVEHLMGCGGRGFLLSTLLRQGERWGLSEFAHARCWVLRDRMRWSLGLVQSNLRAFSGAGVCRWRGGYRPYFENYTVDASIFEPAFGLVRIDDLKDH